MAANYFDKYDQQAGNYFDKYDEPVAIKPEKTGMLRAAADIPVQVGRGVAVGVKALSDVFGADNPVSRAASGVEDFLGGLLSAQAKNDQAEIARIMKEAEDKGVGDQVAAAVKAFATAPVDMLSQALGTAVPVIAGGLAGSVARLGAAGVGAISAGIGAGMGAGTVKGQIYDAVKQELLANKVPEAEAEKRAQEAQAYGGKNLDQILMGAGIGAAEAAFGAERILTGLFRKGAVKPSTLPAKYRIPTAAATEAVPEMAQAAQEQVAQNIALQREGYDVPTMRGVVGQAALEGIAGMGLGAITGAVQRTEAAKPEAEPPKPQATAEPQQAEAEAPKPVTGEAGIVRPEEETRISREVAEAAEPEVAPPATAEIQPIAEEAAVEPTPAEPVAPPAAEPIKPVGAAGMGQRMVNAANRFRDSAVEQFGLTPEQADRAMGRLMKEKVLSLDPVTGQFKLKDGRFWDRDVLLRAAGETVSETAPAQAAPIEAKPVTPPIQSEQQAKQQHAVQGLGVVEVPVNEVQLSEDVPQFKSDADQAGVVERLEGKFERTGVAPIQVWRRLNGRLEVISGRHRLDLAQRTGEATIPAQIHDEASGFDATKAATLDAELNIRDGQGKVKDYVVYFEKSGITEDEAKSRGLLGRALGKRAWAIASKGSEELIAAHRGNVIDDAAAEAIARAAPGDSRLQAVGIKAIQDGKNTANAVNMIQAVRAMTQDRVTDTTFDMFGFDDSAIKEAENMAKAATQKQAEIDNRLRAISGAAKRPDIAKKEGVDVRDPNALKTRIEELKKERAAWDNWATNPDLVAEVRQSLQPTTEEGEGRAAVSDEEAAKISEQQAKDAGTPANVTEAMDEYAFGKQMGAKQVTEMKQKGEKASITIELRQKSNKELATSVAEGDVYGVINQLVASQNPLIAQIGKLASQRPYFGIGLKSMFPGMPWPAGAAGAYSPQNGIAAVLKKYADREHVVAHEIVHYLTYDAINNPTEDQKPAIQRLQKLFSHVKQNIGADGQKLYGLTNLDEFVAEANSNVNFQYKLRQIKYQNQTAWGAFTKFVAQLLGLGNDTALTEIIALTEELASPESRTTVAPPGVVLAMKPDEETYRGEIGREKPPTPTAAGQQALNTINQLGMGVKKPEEGTLEKAKAKLQQIGEAPAKDTIKDWKKKVSGLMDYVDGKLFSADAPFENKLREGYRRDMKDMKEFIGAQLAISQSQAVNADAVSTRSMLIGKPKFRKDLLKWEAVEDPANEIAKAKILDKIAEKYGLTKEEAVQVAHTYLAAANYESILERNAANKESKDKVREKARKLDSEIVKLNAEYQKRMDEQREQAETEIAKLQGKIRELKSEGDRESEIADLKDRIGELRKEREPGKLITQLKKEIKALREEHAEQTKEIERLGAADVFVTPEQAAMAQPGLEIANQIPEVKEITALWNQQRENIKNVLVETGLWTPEYADAMMDNAAYVPFYREMEEDSDDSPEIMIRGLQVKAKEHKLKGSSKPVANVFENMARWQQYAINRAIRNHKALQMVDAATQMPFGDGMMATKVSEAKRGKNITRVWRDGKQEFYEMADPLFVDAFKSLGAVSIPSVKYFTAIANKLRQFIVLYPMFSVAQLSQDSVAAMFSSGLQPRFALKIPYLAVKHAISTFRGTNNLHNELINFGVVGVRDFNAAVSRDDAAITAGIKMPPGGVQKVKYVLERIAMSADNAVRQAVYEAAIQQPGVTQAEALEKAFEVINFRRRGSSKLVNLIGQTVPFFYAYLSAQRVAYKTITGVGISPVERKAAIETLIYTSAAVMALSFMYAMANGDDEAYEKTPGNIRDRSINIPGTNGFRIPLRPDFFLFPKIIAEHTYHLIAENGFSDPAKFKKAMADNFFNATLSPNVVPQAFKPAVEIGLNYDFFSGKPIVGFFEQNKEAGRQFNDSTSEFAKMMGGAGLSPQKVDHFIRGYFGTVGGLFLYGTNFFIEGESGVPRPELSFEDAIKTLPGVSALKQKPTENALKVDFYELRDAIEKAKNTYDDIKKRSPEGLQDFIENEENYAKLALEKSVTKIADHLSDIRRTIQQVSEAPEDRFSAAEKQERIKELKEVELQLLKSVNLKEMREMAKM